MRGIKPRRCSRYERSKFRINLTKPSGARAVVDEASRLRHQRHVASLHRMLSQIEAALGKVHDGTYGTCDGCQNSISPNELAHEPAAHLLRRLQGSPPRVSVNPDALWVRFRVGSAWSRRSPTRLILAPRGTAP